MTQNEELLRQLLEMLTTTIATLSRRESPDAINEAKDTAKQKHAHRDADRYVIVRGVSSGVHAGYLKSQDGSVVRLRESRRLWRWQVPMGAPSFLSGVATRGLDHAGSKVGTPIALTITDGCEIIDVSATARESIRGAPEVERTQ
jgi:hypothetical protein